MNETRNSELARDSGEGNAAGYRRLDAWRLADDLAVEMFHLTKSVLANDRWLRSQIMRAAVSVPANIAEGYSRSSNKEFLQFLSIARASLAEVEYYLHFLGRTEQIDSAALGRLGDLLRRSGQTIFGLMKSVRSDLSDLPTNRRYLREAGIGSDATVEQDSTDP